MMNPIARRIEPAIRVLQIVCGWALLAICAATLFEILARRLFLYSIQGINEIGAYLLAIVSAYGFSYALLQRAHSRVDFLFNHYPRPMVSILNVVAALSLSAFGVFAAWQAYLVLDETLDFSSRANTPLQTPLWIPQSLWFAGIALFAAIATLMAVHAVILLARDRQRLNRYYGPLSLDEEISLETQGTLPPMDEQRQ
jgi:TRAP-type C4-dicarboxylate transport system permease small subunit